MNTERIRTIERKIKSNKEKLKAEKGNYRNQQILRLKIQIDELQMVKGCFFATS